MRLVHLSDLHLGFRQYQRLTPTGINQREADVAATASRAVAQIIACAPDLIVVLDLDRKDNRHDTYTAQRRL